MRPEFLSSLLQATFPHNWPNQVKTVKNREPPSWQTAHWSKAALPRLCPRITVLGVLNIILMFCFYNLQHEVKHLLVAHTIFVTWTVCFYWLDESDLKTRNYRHLPSHSESQYLQIPDKWHLLLQSNWVTDFSTWTKCKINTLLISIKMSNSARWLSQSTATQNRGSVSSIPGGTVPSQHSS